MIYPMPPKQPDDPGEKFDLKELEASWATTPYWVKVVLIVMCFAALWGLLT